MIEVNVVRRRPVNTNVLRHYALSIRDTVLSAVHLLASAQEQRDYERDVPIADVLGELAETGHDLFHPKSRDYVEAFSDDELRDLAYLYGLVREATRFQMASVTELHKRPEWRRVMAVAKDLDARLAGP